MSAAVEINFEVREVGDGDYVVPAIDRLDDEPADTGGI
jgi:hypothetical protein